MLGAVKSTFSPPNSAIPLTDLKRGDFACVEGLDSSASPAGDAGEGEALLARLRDLGFVAGARCEVIARMWLGGDPLAVRIGGSTFALRRAEACAVRVQRLQEQPIESAGLDSGNASAANAAIA
jgi:ferrous iron transport protein A